MHGRKIIVVTVIMIVLTGLTNARGADRKPTAYADLAAYAGADREQILLAGAKTEGKVLWYTSLTGGPNQEIPKAFEAKYPGLKVETYRGSSNDLMAKIMAEAQAKRYLVDVIEGTLPVLRAMRDISLVMPYTSPHLAQYPAMAKEKAGKGSLYSWASVRETYIGLGYNKNIIPALLVPKSYEDLLKPQFKGKLGFSTADTGSRVIGAMIKFKGADFLKKLKNQDIRLYAVSGRALADMVISGEVGASPTIFRSQASASMAKGAPIGWVPMEVVPTNMGGVAISSRSSHPYGTLLLLDFILSPEGQKILEKFGLDQPVEDAGFKRWYPEEELTTDQYEDESTKWDKALNQIGRK